MGQASGQELVPGIASVHQVYKGFQTVFEVVAASFWTHTHHWKLSAAAPVDRTWRSSETIMILQFVQAQLVKGVGTQVVAEWL